MPRTQQVPSARVTTNVVPPSGLGRTPGAVQAHGVLLALDDDLVVVMCSANTAPLLGVEAAHAVGRPLAALVGTDLAARVGDRRHDRFGVEPMVAVADSPAGGSLGGAHVEVLVHRSGSRIVLELEPAVTIATTGAGADFQVTRAAMARLAAVTDLDDLTDLLVREVSELTGFDRVLVV